MPAIPKILVTGASGLLGSSVFDAFQAADGFEIIGLAHSRPASHLAALDLLDERAVDTFITQLRLGKGDWIIHCAAERRPDVAQQNPEKTEKLNVAVPQHLARLASTHGFTLLYVSTDYVFDGTSAPYSPSDPTHPVNLYGRTKRDGERAILDVPNSRGVVLRVPILYGPASNNSDSAVNTLLDVVRDQSGKQYKMDHYATRYPTNVLDIANFLVRLARRDEPLPPIVHYSAGEPFTKYEMCLVFAKILNLPSQHIIPVPDPPQDGTPRPANTQLDVRDTEKLLEGSGDPDELEGLGWCLFEEWWTQHLMGSRSA